MDDERVGWAEGGGYQKAIRVDGDAYIEVGIKDPDGDGYYTRRIPFDKNTDRNQLREQVEQVQDRLRAHLEGIGPPEEEWFEEVTMDY